MSAALATPCGRLRAPSVPDGAIIREARAVVRASGFAGALVPPSVWIKALRWRRQAWARHPHVSAGIDRDDLAADVRSAGACRAARARVRAPEQAAARPAPGHTCRRGVSACCSSTSPRSGAPRVGVFGHNPVMVEGHHRSGSIVKGNLANEPQRAETLPTPSNETPCRCGQHSRCWWLCTYPADLGGHSSGAASKVFALMSRSLTAEPIPSG